MTEKRFKQTGLGSFFGSPIYERLVPRDHFLVQLNRVIDWNGFTAILLPAYKGLAEEGRPPYPPVMILKMLLIAYLYDFSERQVEEATNMNLAIKEFVGLAVDELAPDHSTLSEFNRRIREAQGWRSFEAIGDSVLRQAQAAGIRLGQIQVVDSVHTVADVDNEADRVQFTWQIPGIVDSTRCEITSLNSPVPLYSSSDRDSCEINRAMLEHGVEAPGEVLTVSPRDPARDRWLERTVSRSGERLAQVRDAVFELARPRPHHLVLDLNAGSGLLTWEAVRRTPEGQVWALEADATAARALEQQAGNLDALQRPVVLARSAAGLTAEPFGEVRFDVVVGRNVLAAAGGEALFPALHEVLAAGGKAVLAEPHAREAQRLYELLDLTEQPELAERLRAAEEAIYAEGSGRFGPAPEALQAAALAAGFADARVSTKVITTPQRLARRTVDAWFRTGGAQPSYAELLGAAFDASELEALYRLFVQQLADVEVPWSSVVFLLSLTKQA